MFARITDNDVINAVKKCNLLSIYSFNKKMLFHYTSFEALQKILLSAPAKGKELCVRATRYDCFEDQTEFRYGIDRTRELMEEIEKVDFTEKFAWKEQHFIARHFDSDIILARILYQK